MSFTIEHRMDIAAPAEVVWEVITDAARYGEWNPFVVECRSTFKPGDPIDMKVMLGKRAQQQREWMAENEPVRHLAYRMKPVPLGALSSFRTHDLEPAGPERTRYRSHFQLNGWLMGVVRGLFRRQLEAGFTGMSEGLKRRAESLWAQRKTTARG